MASEEIRHRGTYDFVRKFRVRSMRHDAPYEVTTTVDLPTQSEFDGAKYYRWKPLSVRQEVIARELTAKRFNLSLEEERALNRKMVDEGYTG